jgi:hypothetical protein
MCRWRWEMGVMDCRRRASRAEVVRFAKIWLLLLLMLICCERKNTVSSLKSIAKVTLKKQASLRHHATLLIVLPGGTCRLTSNKRALSVVA